MTNINLENLYRGIINENQTFYLAARLNGTQDTLIKTGLDLSSSSPHFLLCLDRYENAGIRYHRLYWSNDPKDFMPQLKGNSYNQGAVKLIYRTSNRNSYNLSYQTNLNYQLFDSTLITYGLDNIEKTTSINQERNNSFNIVPGLNGNYNIDNNIHTSVIYDITSISNIGQDWNFRTNLASTSGGSEDRPDLATFTSNNNAFEKLKAKAVKVSDSPSTSILSNKQLNLTGFTAVTNYLGLDSIPTNSGIAYMEQGGSSEYFVYNKYDPNTNHLTLGERGLFGTAEFTPATGSTLTITICIENHIDNFKTIKEILTTNYSENETYLDIFFIPTIRYNVLTRGYFLENISNYDLSTNANAINYYNYITGKVYTNGVIVRDISFLTNYLNNSLPTNFSSTKMDSNYPLISIYNTGNTVNSSSTVIWTQIHDSLNSYYYNYCRGNDLCGNCMGLTETRAYHCHVNNNTLENYKFSTTAGNLTDKNASPPLSDNPKNSQINNIYKNYTVPIILVSATVFILLIFLFVYIGLIKEKNIDLQNIMLNK
jgi:hypothetical protein